MSKLVKQFRQRFGISAPKMTVQTHVAWYWRWLGMLVFLSLALALAAWMYDAGRRFAGFDRSELQNEFARLRESMGPHRFAKPGEFVLQLATIETGETTSGVVHPRRQRKRK